MKTKLICLFGLMAGLCAVLLGNLPDFLLRLEVAAVCFLACLHGFAGFNPRVPAWVNSRPIQGIACIYMGCAAMFIPLNFLASGWLLGRGIQMVMDSFPKTVVSHKPSMTLGQSSGEIVVIKQSGEVVTRN
jgi:hypothetical protein